MPQSLDQILLHLVFSTKDRTPWLHSEIRPRVHAYLATVVRGAGCECPRVGGVADHVHLAIFLSRTITVAKLVEEIKTSSSRWIKSEDPTCKDFAWQRGYGVFSVSMSQVASLVHYIDHQESHHHRTSFQEEYRALLAEAEITFDERYMWD